MMSHAARAFYTNFKANKSKELSNDYMVRRARRMTRTTKTRTTMATTNVNDDDDDYNDYDR